MSADKEARRLGFETKVLAAFAAAALVVAALAATTWKMSQDAIEGALRLSRTHEVLTGLADAKGYSYLVELSTQNYRVSGDPAHLVERDTAIAARDAALRRIEALTADNPGQQARLKQAGQVIAERLAISRRTELLRRTEGPEAANAYVAGAPLKETRERLFHLLGEMEAEEHRLLAERQALQARRHAMETMAALASALAVLLLLAANFVLIRRQMRATEAARNAAELANRAKDSFLATMSHEIRTPLGGLLGMLELLSLSRLDADQADVLQSARESGRSLLRILNDILDWSKIEDGKLELAPQATSIAALVARVLNTYARVASARSVTLEPHIDARLGPAHLVDPLRLSQVLNNFVSNAIKFSHVGGRVELRAERVARHADAEEIRFSVQDKGIGIDPDEQQRLFQRYGQASADTARMYGGTGLGLSICRRLAELMQGRIELDSAPGRGSTISLTLTLPIAAAAVESEPDQSEIDTAAFAPPLVAGVAAADAPLVLVVDDHPNNRKLLALQLGQIGLRAETAENGEAALALWREGGDTRRFALVITDCHMPVLDGYQLSRAIRADEAADGRPRTPVFAWTANALADEREKCRAAGMDELLVKPVNLARLKMALAAWLPRSAAVQTATIAVPPAPALCVPSGTSTPVDVAVLAALVGNDPAILRDFLLDFRAGAATIADELSAACANGEMERVEALAHKLKSSARSVGALALGELCAEMEAAGKAGQSAVLPRVWLRFTAEMEVVDAALAELTTPRDTPDREVPTCDTV